MPALPSARPWCLPTLLLATACGGASAPTAPPPAAVATQLTFTVSPADLRTQAVFATAPAVNVRDSAGARVIDSTASITVSVTDGTTGAVLRGPTTLRAVNGVANYPGLSIDSAGHGYRLTASATGLTSATSVT